eukprot:6058992-Pleurochrysis_carterae.AAC.1
MRNAISKGANKVPRRVQIIRHSRAVAYVARRVRRSPAARRWRVACYDPRHTCVAWPSTGEAGIRNIFAPPGHERASARSGYLQPLLFAFSGIYVCNFCGFKFWWRR